MRPAAVFEWGGVFVKVAILTEVSTRNRNTDIMKAVEGLPHTFYNLGMKGIEGEPELSIVETGFLSGLLLNLGCVDFVIGGCGTGQGYMNCAAQYPGVVCGLLDDPLNAWLFPQINAGNCVSLALNKDYGWAGEQNLIFILRELFSVESGGGYPEHRKIPQKRIRERMQTVSQISHYSMEEILKRMKGMEPELLKNALTFPGIMQFIEQNYKNEKIFHALLKSL